MSKLKSYEERKEEQRLKKLTMTLSSKSFHALLSLPFFEWERDEEEWPQEVEFYSKHGAYLVYNIVTKRMAFYTHVEPETFLEEILKEEGSEEILFQLDLISKYYQKVGTYARRKSRYGN